MCSRRIKTSKSCISSTTRESGVCGRWVRGFVSVEYVLIALWLYPIPGTTASPSRGKGLLIVGPLDWYHFQPIWLLWGAKICPSSCIFLRLPTLIISKNAQHQLNMDVVGQRYKTECHSGWTYCCLGQWFQTVFWRILGVVKKSP